jgi:cell division protein ZapA (FtsZ GTPase activity inhibitor)|tara:strand:- start:69 stop:410 length:342 start_codon:yes stop_codon:yes gene_type:complete
MSKKVTVKININGTVYPVSCEFGEEERLIKSSEEVNKAIQELSSLADSVGETRLLAMASLLIADKLIEKTDVLDKEVPVDIVDNNSDKLIELIDWIEKATARMNKVAKLLEKN